MSPRRAPEAVGAVAPTPVARQRQIVELLSRHAVPSQAVLARLLAEQGVVVTQATLSRDLDDLRAVKVPGPDGVAVYAVPAEGGDPTPQPVGDAAGDLRLDRVVADLLVSAAASANLVVARTPPGGAAYLASAIDHAGLPPILGTVAGDDTVLIVTADPAGGARVAAALLARAGRRR